ncbi:MAG: RNA-binding protein [Rothia sp. (in: high G+C Gram-positive bacteria)]|uniref:RNA-binding protein n=1 Tax=Rothia sp. (in: high G+C Gram-positive bacteria) TaxID=1885016 RepID=UPI0026DF93E1|nr:RNA-binding protein [Rothia sp. (in: high G+C Gram-positive bacteria)]MDO5750273.1 RNA-binding protein [Rothia sp. (in: high G+C Gram-positive bacteria)]
MGLNYPLDLAAWSRWQQRQNRVRWAKHALKSALTRGGSGESAVPAAYLHTPVMHGEQMQVLVVLDSFSPTSRASLLEPVKRLQAPAVILAPGDAREYLEGEWSVEPVELSSLAQKLPEVQIVLSLGHYLALGYAAYDYARAIGAQYWVVQHGLLVPNAPPLPIGSVLLAFSQQDADYWKSGRKDIRSHAVGSQLLYTAAQTAREQQQHTSGEIVFLGQMHGAELPRASFARAAYTFLKNNGGVYRPHPSEKDKLSTLTHSLWEKTGIKIDRSSAALKDLTNPVVSIFSTGVLEAAIRGIDAWVYHPAPPAWLEEFWDRYGMHRWGETPTPAPEQPETEPAQKIAELIMEELEN